MIVEHARSLARCTAEAVERHRGSGPDTPKAKELQCRVRNDGCRCAQSVGRPSPLRAASREAQRRG